MDQPNIWYGEMSDNFFYANFHDGRRIEVKRGRRGDLRITANFDDNEDALCDCAPVVSQGTIDSMDEVLLVSYYGIGRTEPQATKAIELEEGHSLGNKRDGIFRPYGVSFVIEGDETELIKVLFAYDAITLIFMKADGDWDAVVAHINGSNLMRVVMRHNLEAKTNEGQGS